jgi:hypothetical protein
MDHSQLIRPSEPQSYLDFSGLYEKWRTLADDKRPDTCIYHDLWSRIQKFPDLIGSQIDPERLEADENKLGFGLILGSLFPLASQENKIMAISKPFDFRPLFATPLFHAQFLDASGNVRLPAELNEEQVATNKKSNFYNLILNQIYGVRMKQISPMIFQFRGGDGVIRHFQIQINTQFVKVVAKGPIPSLQDFAVSCKSGGLYKGKLGDLMEIIPLELFEFHGFVLWEAIDLTVSQSVATLNEAVLRQEHVNSLEFMTIVEESVKSLLGIGRLKVGLASLQSVKGRMVVSEGRLAYSYLISQLRSQGGDQPYAAIVGFLSEVTDPVILKDLQESIDGSIISQVAEMGLQEIILYPLKHNGHLVGVLELCSLEKDTFDPVMLDTLRYLAPSLSLALHRQAENLDSRIKSIIRKNFTAIHPVVEWKFDDIALDYVLEEEAGNSPVIKPIVFRDVYPLYAAVDIKNSSVERNKSIHDDFAIQLDRGKAILELAARKYYLPFLDSLINRVSEFQSRLNLMLLTEEELRITTFFSRELEPVFTHLADQYQDLSGPIKSYFDSLDPQLRIISHHRNIFERNLQEINQLVSSYMDAQEVEIQKIFPHYFEKFRTDGIEYNIYIGQSLVRDRKFDLMYLNNLRLWQLQSLIEVYHLMAYKKNRAENPLEITQLILAHTTPISISFRLDERKFDVEGAYNIRYEIMKKRIDKALVAHTHERLVQPGKIAIVYSQESEAIQYRDFIHFLQNKGQLADEVEELVLEEMHGVFGLKAIRVTILPQEISESEEDLKLITERKEG